MRDGSCTTGYGVITDLLPDIDVEQFDIERKKAKKARLKAEQEAAGQQFCLKHLVASIASQHVASSRFCSLACCGNLRIEKTDLIVNV